MIAGQKVSIVDPTPGTTRDRVSAIVELQPPYRNMGPAKSVELIDTGGYGVYEAEGGRFNEIGVDLAALRPMIEKQIALAVSSADLILFCVDAQNGITPLDREVAKLLREGRFTGRRGRGEASRQRDKDTGDEGDSAPLLRNSGASSPTLQLVATKVDGPKWEAHGHEIAALGLGEPWLISSMNNYMRREFLDALWEKMPPPEDAAPVRADLNLAIIGKRNAGKSTLVNALAGEQRVIVSEIAGTTRDAIDVRIEKDGKSILLIDTAGLRRKKSFANQIEWWAYDRAKRSIDRADVVLILIDATEPTSQVDEQLAMLVQKAYKPCILVVNKWDLVRDKAGPTGKPVTTSDYEQYLRRELQGVSWAPVAFVSASTGLNLGPLMGLAFEMNEQAGQRITTGQLNRLVREILARHNPPSKLGTFAKLLYTAQVRAHPPTIVLVVNKPELFTPNYLKFLTNRFREELPFGEVPIRILVRGRKPQKDGGIDPTLADREVTTAEEIAEVEADALEAARAEDLDADAYFAEEGEEEES